MKFISSQLLNAIMSMVILANVKHVQAAPVDTGIGAYFCNDINWENDCAHWKNLNSGQCYTLDAGHQDSISSFGPDSGVYCELHADYSCGSSPSYITNPGYSDLRTVYYESEPGVESTINDATNSFQCYRT